MFCAVSSPNKAVVINGQRHTRRGRVASREGEVQKTASRGRNCEKASALASRCRSARVHCTRHEEYGLRFKALAVDAE